MSNAHPTTCRGGGGKPLLNRTTATRRMQQLWIMGKAMTTIPRILPERVNLELPVALRGILLRVT